MQETDIRRLRLIMIRICNVAIYFNSKLLSWQKAVACETMMLASELPSHLVDKLKDSAADGKSKVVHKSVGLGRNSFMLILGRVRLGHFTGWVGSRNWTHIQF